MSESDEIAYKFDLELLKIVRNLLCNIFKRVI